MTIEHFEVYRWALEEPSISGLIRAEAAQFIKELLLQRVIPIRYRLYAQVNDSYGVLFTFALRSRTEHILGMMLPDDSEIDVLIAPDRDHNAPYIYLLDARIPATESTINSIVAELSSVCLPHTELEAVLRSMELI